MLDSLSSLLRQEKAALMMHLALNLTMTGLSRRHSGEFVASVCAVMFSFLLA